MNIHIVAASIERSTLSFPLGSLAIYVSLQENSFIRENSSISHDQYFIDQDDPARIARHLAKQSIDLLGLSIYLFNREWMNDFIKAFSKLSPTTTIFAGGPETIAHPYALLDEGCSFLLLGEGEESSQIAIEKILKGEKVEGRGIFTRESPKMINAYPQELSTLPSILLHPSIDLNDYLGVLWEFTRGCPYNCAFCFESKGSRLVRTYDLDRIERELDYLIKMEVSHVFVLDPTFNMSQERTISLLTLLVERSDSAMHYTFEIRAELLDEKSASLFAQLYCSLQIGLQSSNVEVLQTINRSFEPTLFKKKIKLLNTYNVVFGLDLIIGLPKDTYSSFLQSLDYAIECRPSNIDIFLLALLPGTEVFDKRETFALQYQSEAPYELVESTTMSAQEIQKAMKVKHGCDIFYTKGSAVMWFHLIVETLEIRPSLFFEQFDAFMEREHLSDEDETYELQDLFISYIFKREQKEKYLPVILSYIEMHQGISFYQETGENPVVSLYYEPNELIYLDTHSVEQLYERKKPMNEASDYLLFGEDGKIFFEKLMA